MYSKRGRKMNENIPTRIHFEPRRCRTKDHFIQNTKEEKVRKCEDDLKGPSQERISELERIPQQLQSHSNPHFDRKLFVDLSPRSPPPTSIATSSSSSPAPVMHPSACNEPMKLNNQHHQTQQLHKHSEIAAEPSKTSISFDVKRSEKTIFFWKASTSNSWKTSGSHSNDYVAFKI